MNYLFSGILQKVRAVYDVTPSQTTVHTIVESPTFRCSGGTRMANPSPRLMVLIASTSTWLRKGVNCLLHQHVPSASANHDTKKHYVLHRGKLIDNWSVVLRNISELCVRLCCKLEPIKSFHLKWLNKISTESGKFCNTVRWFRICRIICKVIHSDDILKSITQRQDLCNIQLNRFRAWNQEFLILAKRFRANFVRNLE